MPAHSDAYRRVSSTSANPSMTANGTASLRRSASREIDEDEDGDGKGVMVHLHKLRESVDGRAYGYSDTVPVSPVRESEEFDEVYKQPKKVAAVSFAKEMAFQVKLHSSCPLLLPEYPILTVTCCGCLKTVPMLFLSLFGSVLAGEVLARLKVSSFWRMSGLEPQLIHSSFFLLHYSLGLFSNGFPNFSSLSPSS
jgi:hypothetical protein